MIILNRVESIWKLKTKYVKSIVANLNRSFPNFMKKNNVLSWKKTKNIWIFPQMAILGGRASFPFFSVFSWPHVKKKTETINFCDIFFHQQKKATNFAYKVSTVHVLIVFRLKPLTFLISLYLLLKKFDNLDFFGNTIYIENCFSLRPFSFLFPLYFPL